MTHPDTAPHPRDALFGADEAATALPVCDHYCGVEARMRKSLALQAELGPVFDITLDCEDGAPIGAEAAHAHLCADLALSADNRFGRVGAYRNTHHVTVRGRHGFSIQQLNIEKAGPRQTDENNAWQTTRHDLNDPDNLGVGDITHWVVLGNVGAVEDFNRNGGASVRVRRIGAAP